MLSWPYKTCLRACLTMLIKTCFRRTSSPDRNSGSSYSLFSPSSGKSYAAAYCDLSKSWLLGSTSSWSNFAGWTFWNLISVYCIYACGWNSLTTNWITCSGENLDFCASNLLFCRATSSSWSLRSESYMLSCWIKICTIRLILSSIAFTRRT